ncbi:MAG TPA: RimK family protein [Gammaproteobacteria bacterium]
MTTQIVVVESLSDWNIEGVQCNVVHADDYLTGQEYFRQKNVQVINLCRSYSYLSVGYYCSLLAEARNHRVIPSVKSMLDLSRKSLYSLNAEDLDELVQKSLKNYQGEGDEIKFSMQICFGRCKYESLADLARQIFEIFPVPLLKVTLRQFGKWRIDAIKVLPLSKLDAEGRVLFAESFNDYQRKRWRAPKERPQFRYDMAMLVNPDDPLPPSDEKALNNFIKAGRAIGIDVELIEKRDYARLAEYDALFIRDTTRIDHYTYRFAKKAEAEGMVVIDDPRSIQLCTNKVYLAELLRANKVPTPKTVIMGKNDRQAAEEAIGYPMVLKVPDGAFSQGVKKAESHEQMIEITEQLFKDSELILAQEYLYTSFDWRIGVLNRQPIYASQYFMSKKHWQIVNYDKEGHAIEGNCKTHPVGEAPPEVVTVALRAANLIGDGLYGVDLKQSESGKVYVIEVNDNPSIETGVEDASLKDELYNIIMREFLRRLELRHNR